MLITIQCKKIIPQHYLLYMLICDIPCTVKGKEAYAFHSSSRVWSTAHWSPLKDSYELSGSVS